MKNRTVATLFCVSLCSQATAYPLTPENVSSDFSRRAPTAVISDLYKSGRYEKILGFIGKGREQWILLAPILTNGTDAGTAETLTISLAEALPLNPKAVLSVIKAGEGDPLNVNEVCSAPFIEPSKKMLSAYFKLTIPSVSGVVNPELSEMKAACLKSLVKAKAIP